MSRSHFSHLLSWISSSLRYPALQRDSTRIHSSVLRCRSSSLSAWSSPHPTGRLKAMPGECTGSIVQASQNDPLDSRCVLQQSAAPVLTCCTRHNSPCAPCCPCFPAPASMPPWCMHVCCSCFLQGMTPQSKGASARQPPEGVQSAVMDTVQPCLRKCPRSLAEQDRGTAYKGAFSSCIDSLTFLLRRVCQGSPREV